MNEIIICITSINVKFQCKISKQTGKKIIFSRKTKKICHPSLSFNNSIVSQSPYQKHLAIFIDARLTFEKHLKVITTKVNKSIGLLWKLKKTLQKLYTKLL